MDIPEDLVAVARYMDVVRVRGMASNSKYGGNNNNTGGSHHTESNR